MASIIIAGRPNSELTSYCILLSEELMKYFPSINCIRVLKHPEEWSKYSEEVCRLFGFQKSSHPLIYFSNGEFIGDKEAFFIYVKNYFNLSYDPNSQTVYNLTQENIKKVNSEYNIRLKGLVLRDKIEKIVEALDFNDEYNTLNYDYLTFCDLGVKFFYKYDIKFAPSHYELYLSQTDDNIIECDMNSMKIIDNNHATFINNSLEPRKSIINNTSIAALTKKDGSIINNSNQNEAEEDEKSEEEIVKKKFEFKTYKNYNIPHRTTANSFIIENNVSLLFLIVDWL